MGRISKQRGEVGEQIARLMLQAAGVEMIEKIATPFFIRERGRDGWVKIGYKSKVSGDIRGIMPGSGRRVLVEVKARDGNLRKSDFRADGNYHQLERLQENHELGGISLIIWINPYENLILRWPFNDSWQAGSDARASLKLENARDLYSWDGIS